MLRTSVSAGLLFLAGLSSSFALAQDYRIERIASGLNQPTFITQAPGDPTNILYYSERTLNANAGFSASNQMGRIFRYDVNTRAKTEILNLSTRNVTNDDGLQTFTFHPDFNVVGSPGYQKMYVSTATQATNAINRVEEYTVSGNSASLSRTILQYNNSSGGQNHTVNWIGFDTSATGSDRNLLYISTGDGNAGATNRPSQNPADLQGKMLRVDVSGGDSYPADNNKNFVIPTSNPLPTYNAAHPGTPINGLGEVWVTGLRNASRSSFDRATGDLYIGDVGENTIEELDFIKAGANSTGSPPIDFGWPAREGTSNGWTSPYGLTNNLTGVASTSPIQQITHPTALAIIAGYKYNGPIASLQGKVFYADFVSGTVYGLDFDRNTASYNGNNGTVTNMTSLALWSSQVVDPTDPTYTSAIGSLYGIDHISSFGEDNAGNLYIVDFGYGTGFNGQYPGAGLGEIFRVTLLPEPASIGLAGIGLLILGRRARSR